MDCMDCTDCMDCKDCMDCRDCMDCPKRLELVCLISKQPIPSLCPTYSTN